MKHRGFILILSALLLMSMLTVPVFAANDAKENIDVSLGQCTISYNTDDWSLFKDQYPVTFVLPNHEDMHLTLNAGLSYAFTNNWGDAASIEAMHWVAILAYIVDYADGLPPGVADCIYSVRFLDKDTKEVWKEDNAIANGKSREFFVGANVKYIQVRSYYKLNLLETLKARYPGGCISLDS